MTGASRLVSSALRRSSSLLAKRPKYNASNSAHSTLSRTHRLIATSNPSSSQVDERNRQEQHAQTPKTSKANAEAASDGRTAENPGTIGGFMRGLIGGQSVAVEDAFVAEAKEQGVDIPPPPPQRHATLVPVRKRKQREEESEDEQKIRDRIFGRFAGSAFMQGAFNAKERVQEKIDGMDNPLVNMFRNLYDRVFAENEMGMVVREIREDDADFRISEFLAEVESALVPKILGAYLNGNRDALKGVCTQEAYSMLNASILERDAEGIVMDTNILYIGDVELTAGRLLEDSPVLIVTFTTQQINCLKNRQGEVVEGREDDIRAVYYAWAFVREVDFEEAKPSGGGIGVSGNVARDGEDEKDSSSDDKDENKPWKLMEMVIRGAHSTI